MLKEPVLLKKFQELKTPFYFYDLQLLRETLSSLSEQVKHDPFHVHYALKANVNPLILAEVQKFGLGADCVSGGEVSAALQASIPPSKVVFAGVGKADWEIELALDHDIFCFNVESVPEMEVINELAEKKGKIARIALRINPNVQANTHHYITTGTNENKFGIAISDLASIVDKLASWQNLCLEGIHFHIGSQITDMTSFKGLCVRVNEVEDFFIARGIALKHINVGGGLGISYEHPDENLIPDFASYFDVFRKHLRLRKHQELHFELGRSVVAQCGSLISKVLYVKEGVSKRFVILDAGFNDLIRPALYQAFHLIENLNSNEKTAVYDVVGPICESSDTFAKNYEMSLTKRGDLIALRSAGAYAEVMASRYNLRDIARTYSSDELE